jgi:hypothetical protein
MTRIGFALAAGIGGFLLAAPAHAQSTATPTTPATGVPVGAPVTVGPGPVMTGPGYTNSTSTRRGLFGRRGRTTYSGPGYTTPYPTYPSTTAPTTAAPLSMPSTSIPTPMPSSQPAGDSPTLSAPRTVPGNITSSSLYPGTNPPGGTTIPPGTTIVNGQLVPASGTIRTADGTIIPANYSMPADSYGPSQPTRRGLFGRLRNRY